MRYSSALLSIFAFTAAALTAAACGSSFSASTGGPGTGGATSSSQQSTGGAGPSSSMSTSTSSPTSSSAGGAGNCTCIPAPEQGWTGPVEIANGMPGTLPPGCGPEWPTKSSFHAQLMEPPPPCDCSCGAVTGIGCSDASQLSEYTIAGCNTVTMPFFVPSTGKCVADGSGVVDPQSASAPSLGVNPSPGASCVISQNSAIPAPTWGSDVLVCGGAMGGGSCMHATDVCVPKQDSGFSDQYCVYRSGDLPCPGGYPSKYTVYTGFTDNRVCNNDCKCSQPMNVVCAGVITLFDNDNCAGGTATVKVDGSCQDVSGPTRWKSESMAVTIDGTCMHSGGGTYSGKVTHDGLATICCQN